MRRGKIGQESHSCNTARGEVPKYFPNGPTLLLRVSQKPIILKYSVISFKPITSVGFSLYHNRTRVKLYQNWYLIYIVFIQWFILILLINLFLIMIILSYKKLLVLFLINTDIFYGKWIKPYLFQYVFFYFSIKFKIFII